MEGKGIQRSGLAAQPHLMPDQGLAGPKEPLRGKFVTLDPLPLRCSRRSGRG